MLGLLAMILAAPSTVHADEAAVARRHAQRGSHLAAAGKCRQAVVEYDKALAALRDPTLLFNRGECHRKLGDADAALADYIQFLSDLPNTPNRAQVEARIADLKKTPAAAPVPARASNASARAPIVASAPVPGRAQREGRGTSVSSPRAGSHTPSVAAESQSTASPHSAGALPEIPSSVGDDNVPGDSFLAAPLESRDRGRAADQTQASLVQNPWFWVAVGTVVAGAGVATFLVLRRDGTSVPTSDLGNYRF